MSIEYRFIQPVDVLFLRGNQLFGDPGSYGECLVPPWPSVAAGAIRSRMLIDEQVDLPAFSQGRYEHPTLGTPKNPGSFTLSGFYLARQQHDQHEILVAPPADLVITKSGDSGAPDINRLRPLSIQLESSFPLAKLPVLTQSERSKAESGYWLTQSGWQDYLSGRTPNAKHLVHSSDLWAFDARVGIGMNAESQSVEEGKLFSTQALVMKDNVGFLVTVMGATPPTDGLLRFGGDGRAATLQSISGSLPVPDYEAICQAKRCRIVLTSPGLFPEGWKLPSLDAENRITFEGMSGRLVSAAVPRADTISGWDLANKKPKSAQRVAPTGSVYWLEELESTPEALCKLAESGLWGKPCEDDARRAEGFNRFTFATY